MRSTGSNPVGNTSESLSQYLARTRGSSHRIGGFDQGKTGVFVPGFSPLDYERKATVLNPQIRVCFRPYPDSAIYGNFEDEKREYSLFYPPENGNLAVIDLGGSLDGKE